MDDLAARFRKTTTSKHCKTNIAVLNNDCLEYIFSFLPIIDRFRIRRVCRQWNIVGRSWQVEKKLDLVKNNWTVNRNSNVTMTIRIFEQILLRCGRFLKNIDFGFHDDPYQYINTNLKANVDFFALLQSHCPNLTMLDISNLQTTSNGLIYAAHYLRNIAELTIGKCVDNCDKALSNLFTETKKLNSLVLRNMDVAMCLYELALLPLRELCFIDVHFSVQAFPMLSELWKLVIIRSSNFIHPVSVSTVWQNLQSLTIYDFTLDSCLLGKESIAKLRNIRSLELGGSAVLNDEILKAISVHCASLTRATFNVSVEVTDGGLASLSALPRLEYLDLGCLQSITDRAFIKMTSLKILKCTSCRNLNTDNLTRLFNGAFNLESLTLTDCNGLDVHKTFK